MDRVEITAAARHQLAPGGPAGERQLIWQAPDDRESPLGLRGLVAMADGGDHPGGGQIADFVLDHLARLLTDPNAPVTDGRERLADLLYQCVLAVNAELLAAGQTCALTCLCFRDDGFALAHVGAMAAYHLRVAHVHPLTTESSALLGTADTPQASIGTGTIRCGDRIVLTGRRLGQVVAASDLVHLVGQTDLEVACERLLRLAADRGQLEPTSITIAQVGPLPVISSSSAAAAMPDSAGEAKMSYQPQPEFSPLGGGGNGRLDQLTPQQWLQYAIVAIVLALLLGIFTGRRSAQSNAAQQAANTAPQSFTPAPQPAQPAQPAQPGAEAGVPVGGVAPTPAAAPTGLPAASGAAAPAAAAPAAAPRAVPSAAAASAKLKLVLTAKGKTFTVTPPAVGEVKLTGLGNYKPVPAGSGWEFTLKSPAKGQDYRFEAVAAKAGAAPASRGELDDKTPRGAGLAPGTYRLVLGKGVEVAEIVVSAPNDLTTPAAPAAPAAAAPAAGTPVAPR